jgi:hypothetical protein
MEKECGGVDVRWKHGWGMIKSRNQSSHTYHEETAREIVRAVTDVYGALLVRF